MMDIKVKNISKWVDHDNIMKQNQKPYTKTKKVIDKGKSKTLKEVKPVKNISKNLQSFLEILHMNCEAMHMSTRILSD